MAGAVPHPRGGPPAVSPVLGRLKAFAALLGGGQRPSPTGAMKRGVAPLWPGCGGRRFWALARASFRPPGRAMQAPRQGQSRRSIFVLDKAAAHRLSHRPAMRVGRDGKTNLLNPFRPVFGKLVWLRFWAVEPTMAPNQRKCPPLGRFGWLRGGSGGHFQHF